MNINIDLSGVLSVPKKLFTAASNIAPGYKTLISSAVLAALGVIQANVVQLIQDPKSFGWAAFGTAIFFAIMRSLTQTTVLTDTSPAPTPVGITPLIKEPDGEVRPVLAMEVGPPISR